MKSSFGHTHRETTRREEAPQTRTKTLFSRNAHTYTAHIHTQHYYGNSSNSKTAQAADRLFRVNAILYCVCTVLYVCVFLMAAVVVRTHTHTYTLFPDSRSVRVLRGRRFQLCSVRNMRSRCHHRTNIEPGYIHGNYSMILSPTHNFHSIIRGALTLTLLLSCFTTQHTLTLNN